MPADHSTGRTYYQNSPPENRGPGKPATPELDPGFHPSDIDRDLREDYGLTQTDLDLFDDFTTGLGDDADDDQAEPDNSAESGEA